MVVKSKFGTSSIKGGNLASMSDHPFSVLVDNRIMVIFDAIIELWYFRARMDTLFIVT